MWVYRCAPRVLSNGQIPPAACDKQQHPASQQALLAHTTPASHSLAGPGATTAVQFPELCHVPLVQLAVGVPVKPPLHVELQVAPDAAGREQFQANPLGTLGLGWLVQSADRQQGSTQLWRQQARELVLDI